MPSRYSPVFRASVPKSYHEVPYVIFLMCGLIPYQIFSETIRRSTNVLISNMNMITKMVFPYELLPVATLATAFVTGGITLVLTLLLMLVLGVFPTFSYLVFLPAFLIPLVLLSTGLAWLVSCLSVVVKDIGHVVPVALHLLLFATPILYSYEMVEKCATHHPTIVALDKLNPLYAIAIGHKIALIGGQFVLEGHTIVTSYMISIVVFITGGVVFNVFKRDLADWF